MTYFNEDFELESRKIENGYTEEEIFIIDEVSPEELVLLSLEELEKEKVNDLPF